MRMDDKIIMRSVESLIPYGDFPAYQREGPGRHIARVLAGIRAGKPPLLEREPSLPRPPGACGGAVRVSNYRLVGGKFRRLLDPIFVLH